MKEEAEFMQYILPAHYTVEPRANGVQCESPIGIDDCDTEHWGYIMEAIKQKFGKRFLEAYHQTCTDHKKFMVYIRPVKEEPHVPFEFKFIMTGFTMRAPGDPYFIVGE